MTTTNLVSSAAIAPSSGLIERHTVRQVVPGRRGSRDCRLGENPPDPTVQYRQGAGTSFPSFTSAKRNAFSVSGV
jgi:hypothetical protein